MIPLSLNREITIMALRLCNDGVIQYYTFFCPAEDYTMYVDV